MSETNTNFISTGSGRRSGSRRSNNSNQSSSINNNSQEANSLRSRISDRSSFITNSRSSNNTSQSSTNDISTNTQATPQASSTLTREDTLDRILELLEDITGEDISDSEFQEILGNVNNTDRTNFSGTKVSGSDLQKVLNNGQEFRVSDSNIKPAEEMKFSRSQVDAYDDHQDAIVDLISEWGRVDDKTGYSRGHVAQLRAQYNMASAAESFHEGREDVWQERSSYQLKDGDNLFTASKIDYMRSQSVGLENLMSEWVSVEDDSGNARSQIAQIRAQIFLVDGAEKYWRNENDFWRLEKNAEYAVEDQDTVKEIYKEIEKNQSIYEAGLLAESNGNDLGESLNSMIDLKTQLNQLRLNPDDNILKMDFPMVTGGVNPNEEKAFAGFKTEFYESQRTGLYNLKDEWMSVEDDSGAALKQIKQINKQIKMVDEALEFWNDETEFWHEFGNASVSNENRQDIEFYLSQITGLENLMDEWVTAEDDTGERDRQVHTIQSQISTIRGMVKDLHTEL